MPSCPSPKRSRSEERRVGKECRSWRDWSSDVCSSDLEPIERSARATRTVKIALVGKYIQLEDAYLSVSEALRHAASLQDSRVEIDWIDSERLEGPALEPGSADGEHGAAGAGEAADSAAEPAPDPHEL